MIIFTPIQIGQGVYSSTPPSAAAPLPKVDSQDNAREFIEKLKNTTHDLKDRKKVLKALDNLSYPEKHELLKFISDNCVISLKLPYYALYKEADKITCFNLSNLKEDQMSGRVHVFDKPTSRELYVLLFSIKEYLPHPDPLSPKWRTLHVKPVLYSFTGSPEEKKFVGEKGGIRFYYRRENPGAPEKIDLDSVLISKLCKLVMIFNRFISDPEKRVQKVTLAHGLASAYYSKFNHLVIDISRPQDLYHEFGHALYRHLIYPNKELREKWDKIHKRSLKNEAFNIVDDSSYEGSDDLGHPQDSPAELFASSVAAYTKNRARFEEYINDPETPPDHQKLGLEIIFFLETHVFAPKIEIQADKNRG